MHSDCRVATCVVKISLIMLKYVFMLLWGFKCWQLKVNVAKILAENLEISRKLS
jgi:hypothetical protein